MRKQKHLIIIALMLLVLPQCKKYPDDGDSIHFRSAKERLCQKCGWNTGGNNFHGFFYKNGTEDGDFFFYCQPFFNNGNWKFIDHYKSIRITNPNNNNTYDFTIELLEKASDGYFYLTLENDTARFQLSDGCR